MWLLVYEQIKIMSSVFLPFRLFVKSSLIKGFILVMAASNLIAWGLIWFRLPERASLNLHYTVFFGIDWIGPWWYAFLFPLIGLGVLVVDFVIAWAFAKRQAVLGPLLLGVGVFAELALLTQSIIVVILNT